MCFLWLNDKNDFFFLDTEMQKKQAHTPYLGKVKKKKGLFPSALWHQRFFMVCSLRYGMPHEPPQDLSHQSTMREWACSQAVCHSFILALLGMVIGSQSTSIDGLALDQDDWVARLSMHVYIALCVLVRGSACLPCMHATLSEQQHICVTPSPLSFEFWVLSIIASTAVLRPWLAGCREGRYSCEQVFLTSPSNYYQDTVESYSHGNEHSGWHSASVMCERGHTLFHIRNKKEQFQCSFLNVEIISIDPNCIHARLHKNVIPRNSQNTQFVHTKCIFFCLKKSMQADLKACHSYLCAPCCISLFLF